MQFNLDKDAQPGEIVKGMNLYNAGGVLIGQVSRHQPLVFTKEIFDKINHGAVFRVVVTHLQLVNDPFKRTYKFLCKKGGGNDWTIYFADPQMTDDYIARHGDKTVMEETVRSICPCDDYVFSLYRY